MYHIFAPYPVGKKPAGYVVIKLRQAVSFYYAVVGILNYFIGQGKAGHVKTGISKFAQSNLSDLK